MITTPIDWILDLFDRLFRHSDPIVQITSAVPSGGYRLRLTFSNGDRGEINLTDYVVFISILTPLADERFFRQVVCGTRHALLARRH